MMAKMMMIKIMVVLIHDNNALHEVGFHDAGFDNGDQCDVFYLVSSSLSESPSNRALNSFLSSSEAVTGPLGRSMRGISSTPTIWIIKIKVLTPTKRDDISYKNHIHMTTKNKVFDYFILKIYLKGKHHSIVNCVALTRSFWAIWCCSSMSRNFLQFL